MRTSPPSISDRLTRRVFLMPWTEPSEASRWPEPSVADALGHVLVWSYALSVQSDRVEQSGDGVFQGLRREIDLRFFAAALRKLLRAADLTAKRAEPPARAQIYEAIAAFHHAVPGAKDVRDRLEHFDAYESGTGHQQKAADITEPSVTYFVRGTGTHTINVDVPGLSTATIEMESAKEAGNALMTAIGIAVDGPTQPTQPGPT
jgi:hypothetical protein